MEFRELLQLAQGNSSIAKKKSEKLGKDADGRNGNVESSAVAAYLAKKKKEKEAQLAAEEEAKRQRIAARVNANIGKKENKDKPPEKKPPEKKPRPPEKVKSDHKAKDSSVIKFDVHESHKKKKDKQHENVKDRRTGSDAQKHEKRKEQQLTVDLKKKEKHKESRHYNEHRKEKQRTELSDSKRGVINKPKSKHKQKPANGGGSGLSFMDLMKLAKCNSENPGSGKVGQKETLKRSAPKPAESVFDPDRSIKVRRKQIPLPSSPPPEPSSKNHTKDNVDKKEKDIRKKEKDIRGSDSSKDKVKKYSEQRHSEQKLKQQQQYQQQQQQQHKLNEQKMKQKLKDRDQQHQKIRPVNATMKPPSRPNKPVQRGLVVETVSSSKNYDDQMQKRRMMNAKRGSGGVSGGIAAQNRGKIRPVGNKVGKAAKRSAHDYEDEFEKEERMLARQRKLFEMRRITGNKNLTEDDLLDDDYDLDEEDDEDGEFIDDTEDAGDVSNYIRSIFGYDRSRYEDSDEDDLADMESSYAQIEKEEARSARIAKIEDDYERMKEEEAEERMQQRKKTKK